MIRHRVLFCMAINIFILTVSGEEFWYRQKFSRAQASNDLSDSSKIQNRKNKEFSQLLPTNSFLPIEKDLLEKLSEEETTDSTPLIIEEYQSPQKNIPLKPDFLNNNHNDNNNRVTAETLCISPKVPDSISEAVVNFNLANESCMKNNNNILVKGIIDLINKKDSDNIKCELERQRLIIESAKLNEKIGRLERQLMHYATRKDKGKN